MRSRPRSFWIGALAGLTAVACLCATALAAPPAPLDPVALVKLRAMSARLTSATGYRFVADTTLDDQNELGQRVQYSNRVDVTLGRPDRLTAKVRGDLHNTDIWFDGNLLTKFEHSEGAVATLPYKGSVEGLLDRLAGQHGVTFPLADFLVNDVYASFVRNVARARYEGIHLVGGVPCHHLVFSQDRIDWQIWVLTGADPSPRKLVITYKSLPGSPQYSATFQSWQFNPELQATQFVPQVPARAPHVGFTIGSPAGRSVPEFSLYR